MSPDAITTALAPRRDSRDATRFLTVYLVLLIALPAQLVVGQLGAAGTPANLVGLVGLLLWVAARLLPTSVVAKGFEPMRVATGLFCATVLASYAAAHLHPMPLDEVTASDRALISTASWAGVTLVTAELVVRLGHLDTLMRRAVWLGGGLASIGIVQFFTGLDIAAAFRIPGLVANAPLAFIGQRSEFRRVAGTTLHPIEFGMVLAALFPLAVHLSIYAVEHRRAHRVLLALIAMAIPMSLSRSAFLGLGVGSIVLATAWSWPRRLRALGATAVFALLMRFLVPGLLGTVKSLFTHLGSDPSVQGRSEDFARVGDFIGRAPWLGRGFGTFLPDRYFFLDNQYLGALIETGAAGLTALVLLFLIGIFTARGARRMSADEERRHLNQAMAASIATVMIGFVTFDGFGFPMIDGVLFFLLGCAGGQWRLLRSTERPRGPRHDTAHAIRRSRQLIAEPT